MDNYNFSRATGSYNLHRTVSKLADLLSVVITTAVILMASWFIEYWGVTTGFPFGDYRYTGILAPHIGGVPLAIMFAWFTLAAGSLLAADSC